MPTAITSTLEPFPTRIVTSSLTNLRLIRSPCFELQILATEPVSNTQVLLRALVRYTSITCISHIPLFTLPSFLSAKYLTSLLAVEALSLRLRSRLGFLLLSSNLLAVLFKVPLFLPFALFLETSGFVNHQHLMLLFDFYLRGF